MYEIIKIEKNESLIKKKHQDQALLAQAHISHFSLAVLLTKVHL